MPSPPIRPSHPFSFGWLDPTFKGFILKCYRELNWGENWKPFELFALFNQILKIILDFRSDKPVLGRYDPKIRCNIDSKDFWILLGIKIICQSIITNGAKGSCAKERKIWGVLCKVWNGTLTFRIYTPGKINNKWGPICTIRNGTLTFKRYFCCCWTGTDTSTARQVENALHFRV